MTCYVPSFSDGKHVHFIDGGDGGYAIAAKQLKQQMKDDPSVGAAEAPAEEPGTAAGG